MMYRFFLIIFFLFCWASFSAQVVNPKNVKQGSYQKAEFPGGDEAFINEFWKMVYAYYDDGRYAIIGKFKFEFSIDKKGKVSELVITPKVKNSEIFIDDMQFAMRKVKQKWIPAKINGTPIKSKYILYINFGHFDYDRSF